MPGGPVDKPIQRAADRLQATPAQVILSWVRSKGVVIVTSVSHFFFSNVAKSDIYLLL